MTKRNSEIAIITRTYNRPQFLRRCLKSINRQSYRNWTNVIINNGGDPDLVNQIIARRPSDQARRITPVHVPQSCDIGSALNLGLRHSKSEFVTILDDDDTWHPDFLHTCVTFLNEPGNSIFGGIATRTAVVLEISINGITIPIYRNTYNPDLSTVDFNRVFLRNRFTANGFVYRRSRQEEIGEYRESISIFEDWHFNLRFVKYFPVAVIQRDLANYHKRFLSVATHRNTTTTLENEEKNLWTDRIRQEVGGYSRKAYMDERVPLQGAGFYRFVRLFKGIICNLQYIRKFGIY